MTRAFRFPRRQALYTRGKTPGSAIASRVRRPPLRALEPIVYSARIDKDYTVRLPPGMLDWSIGMRIYWRIHLRQNLSASPRPLGSFLYGKYQSSRIKKLGTYVQGGRSNNAERLASIARHMKRIHQRIPRRNS